MTAIDVWVGGDGVYWSCAPSPLFRVPTQLFDEMMLMGALETQEDLEALVEKIGNGTQYADDYYTDIWVGQGGNWSGLPSVLYRIPEDVFEYLQQGDTRRTIGGLESAYCLEQLVAKTREEMFTGVVAEQEVITRSRPTNSELKICGHNCTRSSIKERCCKCSDRRSCREEGTYPMYIDGTGWVDEAMRSAGYCHICN
jgi:hypothetical protein